MSYKVETTPNFEREARRLTKKYKSLKDEIRALIECLEENPRQGMCLGENIYKIRLAVKSKGKGKRGGVRIMTQVKILNEVVYMFSIYSKGEKDDISDLEIQDLIQEIS
ncbi:MAG TPA: type II toxin-antitoxin system RelE/ParE family toxin [Prolixibacteraceae bacterium]|nr:type II toxin-antitoxin system RelE/ParE family toxin [Prolixibacteraceae bacterium]